MEGMNYTRSLWGMNDCTRVADVQRMDGHVHTVLQSWLELLMEHLKEWLNKQKVTPWQEESRR